MSPCPHRENIFSTKNETNRLKQFCVMINVPMSRRKSQRRKIFNPHVSIAENIFSTKNETNRLKQFCVMINVPMSTSQKIFSQR